MEPGSFPFSVSLSKLVDQRDRRPKHHACPNVRTQKKRKFPAESFHKEPIAYGPISWKLNDSTDIPIVQALKEGDILVVTKHSEAVKKPHKLGGEGAAIFDTHRLR